MQEDADVIKPQIIREYSGRGKEGEQDIFVLLRPKTNCYKIESHILSVFRSSPLYRKKFWLEYMANLPGDFLIRYNIMHSHYRNKYFFCRYGKKAFTPSMRAKFEKRFKRNFETSAIIGAFDAIERLQLNELELARNWLCSEPGTYEYIEGQTICKLKSSDGEELFVINSDIPSLISQHRSGTNCAVLLLRTSLSYKEFRLLIKEVIHRLFSTVQDFLGDLKGDQQLIDYFNLSEPMLQRGGYKRFFHYSNGPFEQLHDGMDFLYDKQGNHVLLNDMTFAHYLSEQGINVDSIVAGLRNPIGYFDMHNTWEEHSLYGLTYQMDYASALKVYKSMRSQLITPQEMKAV